MQPAFGKFLVDFFSYTLVGGRKFWIWVLCLCAFLPFWAYGFYQQWSHGMIVTGLTDQISWGLYLANFVFLVGVAAAAVTVVFPAYVYKQPDLLKVAVLSEMLAISAVIMCLLFVVAHMGRPDRVWHMIPGIGIYNWPNSMLTWDVAVLNIYLILNLVAGFYYLYTKWAGGELNKKFYMPLIYVAIVWALSIHTVTAFLINTMPARPMWFHSVMPIRFITTAFAAGPAMIIVAFLVVRNNTKLYIPDRVFDILSQIVTWCLGLALFLALSEIVTELYASTEHSLGLQYLMFGKHGLSNLVPFFWVSISVMIISFILLLIPSVRTNYKVLPYICVALFAGIWVEKGMGLLLPGFTPTPIGELTEYYPTAIEFYICLGNWAIGILVFTFLLKGAVGVVLGELKYQQPGQPAVENAPKAEAEATA
ncbi:Sulfite reduction-associated complex DsrMKJOP protein DsrP (= HmeB) [hydrothermal vent metagenome]|uniref:Sulfite reduction-associated complex DsrMKJOP protein DsrP (= HmeB) n=1 Tax=hydrothermal vent metagenome TaxID=652676 RepID=A0A3B1B5S3_9ZZZZ